VSRVPAAVSEAERVVLRPRRLIFWVYLGLVGYSLATFGVLMVRQASVVPDAVVIAIVVQAVIGIVIYLLIRWLDLFEKEPRSLMAVAFVWGAVVATATALQANTGAIGLVTKLGGTAVSERWAPAIAGPLTEEALKLLGVVAVILLAREQVQRSLDGLVYGALSGLGFELVENVLYAINLAVLDPNSDKAAGIAISLARLFLGFGLHPMCTGMAGLGIAYAFTRTDRTRWQRIGVAVLLYLAGYAMHFLWNSPLLTPAEPGVSTLGSSALKYGVLLVFFFLCYRYGARFDFSWFAATMKDESPEILTAAELQALRTRRSRRKARRVAGLKFGTPGRHLAHELQHAQLAVALARECDAPPEVLDTARQRVRAIRRKAAEWAMPRRAAGRP